MKLAVDKKSQGFAIAADDRDASKMWCCKTEEIHMNMLQGLLQVSGRITEQPRVVKASFSPVKATMC